MRYYHATTPAGVYKGAAKLTTQTAAKLRAVGWTLLPVSGDGVPRHKR